MSQSSGDVTALLVDWSRGDGEALERLMPLVFEELRRLARSHFRREPDGHTLQPTALVAEVYMRLADQRRVEWGNRGQFFAFASMLMRRILVDHAKGRLAAKRGAGARRLSLEHAEGLGTGPDLDLVALDEALTILSEVDPRQARVVEMRFFAGLRNEEIAEVLETSVSTVKREWQTARLFLYRELRRGLERLDDPPPEEPPAERPRARPKEPATEPPQEPPQEPR